MFERFVVSLGLKKLEKVKYNKEEIFDKDISDKENNSSLSSNKVKGHLPSNK